MHLLSLLAHSTCAQKMADLPLKPHLTRPPSIHLRRGVDYFGPIAAKRGRATVKEIRSPVHLPVSRAVHLELAHSLDTDSCIAAIRRFMCRRVRSRRLMSDNGTNFVAAERELRDSLALLNHSKSPTRPIIRGDQVVFQSPVRATPWWRMGKTHQNHQKSLLLHR